MPLKSKSPKVPYISRPSCRAHQPRCPPVLEAQAAVSFINFWFRFGYLVQDISRQVILPFVEVTVPRILTQAEYQRLLQTGIRLSELTRLTIQDLEIGKMGNGEMQVVSSGSRKGRVIPLNTKASQALKAYLQDRKASSSPHLFLNRRGKPLEGKGVEKILGKYFQKAGIWGASTHSLRHTFGVQHVVRGTRLKTIQKVMGH